MKPFYEQGGIRLYCGDAREIVPNLPAADCLVIDPPYDDPEIYQWASDLARYEESELVFCDPRTIGRVCSVYGEPAWLFIWDTMSPWSAGPRRPLTRVKFCAWFGALDEYDRDAMLWGNAPEAKNHPSTKQTPLDGRRLTDLWQESLRWVHHPGAGSGSAGTSRFSQRQGEEAMRHAKPVGWLKCLIGNTSSGSVLDPFAGSGAALVAASQLGREAVGIELDPARCEFIKTRLQNERLPLYEGVGT